MHGFQLWVNLPQDDKMMKPRYQEIPGAQIPKATSADGLVTVKVIAGEAMGQKAVIETRTPIIYCITGSSRAVSRNNRCRVTTTRSPTLSKEKDHFGAESERAQTGRWFCSRRTAIEVTIENPVGAKATLEVLLIGGLPLNEPVARYGPFVMNTEREIHQAFEDYRLGRMGAIEG